MDSATRVMVNPGGTIQLTGFTVRLPTNMGTATASGSVDVSNLQLGGALNILGNNVAIVSSP